MAKNCFKSYIWLLETLQSRGHLTLRELQSLWLRSSVNDEQKELASRTFSNHTKSIEDIFGIEIACDRRDNTYYIRNEDEIGGSDIRNWMLAALSLNSLLNESAGLKDRIIFENVPSSQKYLSTVIQAIRDGKVINVTYHSFRKQAPETLVLEPYFLREYFAGIYAGIYGPRVYPDMKAETVVLKVSGMQVKYFKSLPPTSMTYFLSIFNASKTSVFYKNQK